MTALAFFLFMLECTLQSEVVYAFNCGAQTHLQSTLLKYSNDQMYDNLTSQSHRKDSIPPSIIDPTDIQLLLTDRTTQSNSFFYDLHMKGTDHYLLIFKFIEIALQKESQRVFQILIGDEVALEIDIVREVGAGQVLHKWVQMDLRDDVIYINKTIPALNAYKYSTQVMRVTFQRIKGQPKIQALILVKGQDSPRFLSEYIQQQVSKSTRAKEYTSQKYQRPIEFHYKHMTGTQTFDFPEQNLGYYLKKIFSWNSLLSLMMIVLVLFHDYIYQKLNVSFEKNSRPKQKSL